MSPDGRHVVYGATADGTTRLFARALDAFESMPIGGTEGALTADFSPDSQHLVFQLSDGERWSLNRVPLGGGVPYTILDGDGALDQAISVVPDGIVFRTLLVPMDMSADSQRALGLAGTLAENWDATIQLVHVVDPPPVMYYAGNITSRFELDGDLRGRVEVRLRAAGEGLPVTRCIVAEGHPAVEIARVAYEPEIDLIVMSATGSATIDWLPMGSTTARVCRIARKPVLASR